MRITVNGEQRDLAVGTVAELVEALGMAQQAVAVEHNRRVVPKKEHASTALREGDELEVVSLVGGGSQ